MTTTFDTLPLTAIAPSLTNPRKNFNPAKLQELADSIAASGVHQPVLVRPLTGDRLQDTHVNRIPGEPLPTYELVCGERRYRASKLAGATTIPAMIRPLTDAAVLEIQLLENLQRDDLHPMEEAEGYQALCATTGITKEQLGAKIGKSRAYVYNRLKLLDLTTEARRAFYDGHIDTGHAEVIARIPNAALQVKALNYATQEDYLHNTPSLRELQRWVQANMMCRLDRARFDIKSITIAPEAGACGTCDKRTGANPDLFADVDSADVCIDPSCYNAKTAKHDELELAKAAERGVRVLEGQAAQRAITSQHSTGDGYRRLDRAIADVASKKSLKTLLGKDAPAPVLVRDPHTGELIEMLPTDQVNQLLEAKGLITPEKAEADRKLALESEKAKLKIKADVLFRKRAIEDCVAELRKQSNSIIDTPLLQLIAKRLLVGLNAKHREHTAVMLGLGKVATAEGIIEHIEDTDDVFTEDVLLTLLMQHDVDHDTFGGQRPFDNIQAVADALGINLPAIKRRAVAEVQPKVLKAESAVAKATPTAAPTTPTPEKIAPVAAQPEGGRGKGKKIAPAAAARDQKISAGEATQGIAAALQGLSAGPDGESAGTSPATPELGIKVTVNSEAKWNDNRSPYIGRVGYLSEVQSNGRWLIRLPGKRGAVADFVAFEREELDVES